MCCALGAIHGDDILPETDNGVQYFPEKQVVERLMRLSFDVLCCPSGERSVTGF